MQNEGEHLDGDPYCVIPERLAIQKLYLNQAKIDSIEVNENQVIQEAERWVEFAMNQIGSKEKLEEYFNKKISQIREERIEMLKEHLSLEVKNMGEVNGIKFMRKFYNYYISTVRNASKYRCVLVTLEKEKEILEVLDEILSLHTANA